MIKYCFIALLSLALIGCAAPTPKKIEPSVIIQYKFVTAPIPEELLEIPPMVEPIDVKTATEKDVADWIVRSEERMIDVLTKLKLIKENQNELSKSIESKK